MVDRFDGLWHNAIIRCNYDDRNIGNTGTSGTHRRKSFVARCIKERDEFAVHIDLIGTDVLCDTAEFTFNDTGITDVVKQGRLAMVDMSHDRDDRCSFHQIIWIIFFRIEKRFIFMGCLFCCIDPKFHTYQFDVFIVE